MPYPELTLTFIACLAALIGVWSLLILDKIFAKRAPAGEKRPAKRNALVALVITFALGGVGWAMFASLQAKQNQHFVALGHRACRSWSFASEIPVQSFAATIMGRYEGVAGYTCADVSEHFYDLASGRIVKEPPGYYDHLST